MHRAQISFTNVYLTKYLTTELFILLQKSRFKKYVMYVCYVLWKSFMTKRFSENSEIQSLTTKQSEYIFVDFLFGYELLRYFLTVNSNGKPQQCTSYS